MAEAEESLRRQNVHPFVIELGDVNFDRGERCLMVSKSPSAPKFDRCSRYWVRLLQ